MRFRECCRMRYLHPTKRNGILFRSYDGKFLPTGRLFPRKNERSFLSELNDKEEIIGVLVSYMYNLAKGFGVHTYYGMSSGRILRLYFSAVFRLSGVPSWLRPALCWTSIAYLAFSPLPLMTKRPISFCGYPPPSSAVKQWRQDLRNSMVYHKGTGIQPSILLKRSWST